MESWNQANPVGQFQEHLNSSGGAQACGHALTTAASCCIAGACPHFMVQNVFGRTQLYGRPERLQCPQEGLLQFGFRITLRAILHSDLFL